MCSVIMNYYLIWGLVILFLLSLLLEAGNMPSDDEGVIAVRYPRSVDLVN